jgi:hypothetical protein
VIIVRQVKSRYWVHDVRSDTFTDVSTVLMITTQQTTLYRMDLKHTVQTGVKTKYFGFEPAAHAFVIL